LSRNRGTVKTIGDSAVAKKVVSIIVFCFGKALAIVGRTERGGECVATKGKVVGLAATSWALPFFGSAGHNKMAAAHC